MEQKMTEKERDAIIAMLKAQHDDDMRKIAQQRGYEEGYRKGKESDGFGFFVLLMVMASWLVIAFMAYNMGFISRVCL